MNEQTIRSGTRSPRSKPTPHSRASGSNISVNGNCSGNCPSGNNHVLGATDLAERMDKFLSPFDNVEKIVLTGDDWMSKLWGEEGNVYIEDYYYKKPNDSKRTGDHIDLWDGNEFAKSSGAFNTLGRSLFPRFYENHCDMSDISKAKRIVFWKIK